MILVDIFLKYYIIYIWVKLYVYNECQIFFSLFDMFAFYTLNIFNKNINFDTGVNYILNEFYV